MLWKLPTVQEIATMRKQLSLSQYRLARLANISQSMINKFEREQVDMGYSKVVRICEVLSEVLNLQIQRSPRPSRVFVKDIMEKKVIWVEATDKVSTAVNLMTEHAFSQLPVAKNNQSVGSISERILKNHLDKGVDPDELKEKIVEKIMGPPFPEVSQDTILEAISIILEGSGAVLVRKQENIIGITTPADFMKLAKT